MTDDRLLPFDVPAVQRKKASAVFDGSLPSSDGGLVLLREAERSLGLAETLAGCIRDRRNQALVVYSPLGHAALPHAGDSLRLRGCRRVRRAPRGPAVEAGLKKGAGERACAPFPSHHEPPGTRCVSHRDGAHDDLSGRSLLPLLLSLSRRPEATAWCEQNGVDYIFGLAGIRTLHALAYEIADDLKVRRAETGGDRMRAFAAFAYAARSWSRECRVVARLEASARGFDVRYIITSLKSDPRHLYEHVCCTRGQAENLIKMHKGRLAPDRTSCQSPIANQFRLVLHTGAYWLMLTLRNTIPRATPLARPEFATPRLRLLKIGPRVVERATSTRVRIHFASACPDAALFRLLAGRLGAAGP